MRKFIIQSKSVGGRDDGLIPVQSYGYTAIEMVDYRTWLNRGKVDWDYVLNDDIEFVGNNENKSYNYLKNYCVPVGSVEYVNRWLELMCGRKAKPLNIPEELMRFCKREVKLSAEIDKLEGKWYVKSTEGIKDSINGMYKLPVIKDGKYFATRWVDTVVSEWRVFVLDGRVLDVKNYSGDYWVLPDREYVENIVKNYNKRSYVLDVMVSDQGTDIVELHDFFACGLYGFEDYIAIGRMWIISIRELLGSSTVFTDRDIDFKISIKF